MGWGYVPGLNEKVPSSWGGSHPWDGVYQIWGGCWGSSFENPKQALRRGAVEGGLRVVRGCEVRAVGTKAWGCGGVAAGQQDSSYP